MATEATVQLRSATVRVRALRGADEQWLRDLDHATPLPHATHALLARCVREPHIRTLALGDRERLLLALWRLSLGPRMQLVLRCPQCEALMDADVDVAPAAPEPPVAAGRVRALTGEDLEMAASAEDPVLELARRCGGEAAGAGLDAELERLDPDAVADLDAICPECATAFAAPLDAAGALVAELGRRQAQLDGDVHLLSLHYHWPLREILGLPRLDRRAYVDRLLARLGTAAA
jgi:hypothetical protein